ncbi:dipeptide/oligopeptide/nickel ABC transporter ATP-binding protein [Mycobacterium sp. MS1601]|uniref:ATP-binding cassette domain-containing protein n=1 Tax=Mycobacterium sp. MS1601 TaxID=1936029 RepID=UPI0009797961|nr:ATP-binding cassette domain-containing protein [Mycobacterium sp. MS1601]AQA01937.1 dipeptide/oligopeptide/nickel ABC transporter ATP-binding protein [Mycobacterium sp. MS1601]
MTTADEPVLQVEGLTKEFRGGRGRGRSTVRAVNGVSFAVRAGECLAIVGESGSGKSTLARSVLRLVEPDSGSVRFRGQDLLGLSASQMRAQRRHLQMIFQDPYASLHPRRTVAQLIAEPWAVHKDVFGDLSGAVQRRARVLDLLSQVGLPESFADEYPSRLSGGQRQRVAIARAIGLNPQVLVLDEPVSALDVSIQAQIIKLLMTLREQLQLAYLFISHDLALVRLVAEKVLVLYRGDVVEAGDTAEIFANPQHEYTRTLLAASPSLEAPRTH